MQSIAAMLAGGGLEGDETIGEIAGAQRRGERREGRDQRRHGGLPARVPARGGRRDPRASATPHFAYHGPASSTGGSAMVLIVNGPDRAPHRHELRQQRVRPGHARQRHDRARGAPHHDERDEHAARLPRPRHARQSRQVLVLLRRERGRSSRGSRCTSSAAAPRAKRGHRVSRRTASTRCTTSSPRRPSRCSCCFADALCNLGTPNLRGFNQSLDRLRGRARRGAAARRLEPARRAALPHGARAPARGRLQARRRAARRGRAGRRDHVALRASSGPRTSSSRARAAGPGAGRPACPGWGTKWTRSVTTRIDIP